MYTQEELKAARTVISRYSESKGITEEEMREQMKALFLNAIESGDHALDTMFADLKLSGKEPTEDELVAFMYRKIRKICKNET